MPIEIKAKELKITLYTNIPTGNEYEKAILTFALIYRPDLQTGKKIKTNTYPWFTFQIKYDETSLNWMDYDRILKTFFDKNDFEYNFSGYSDVLPLTVEEYVAKMTGGEANNEFYKDEYYRKRTENINNNVMLMIKYILPTKYPVVNNHFDSYGLFNGTSSLSAFFFNPFMERKFLYLKLPSGTYTLVKVTWLNDVMNHPDYLKLVDKEPVDTPIKTGESSNETLASYVRNIKSNKSAGLTLVEAFKPIKQCYKSNCRREFKSMMYCGIQINDNTEQYELALDVELIESEVKPEELKDMNCPYMGDYLGEELIRLTKVAIGRKKIETGKIIKIPLYSKTTKTSRKLGYLEKEEVDEKLKAKRQADDEEYNEIDQEDRLEYDNLAKIFLPSMLRRFRTKMKKYDVTKQNFYFFLNENVRPLLDFLKSSSSSGKKSYELEQMIKDVEGKSTSKKTKRVEEIIIELRDRYGYKRDSSAEPINKYIKSKLDEYSENKNRKSISKETYDEMRFKYDLITEFVKFIKERRDPIVLKLEDDEKKNVVNPTVPTIGGTRRNRKHRSKKKYTRKYYTRR